MSYTDNNNNNMFDNNMYVLSSNLYRNPNKKVPLPPSFQPGPYDVICARGKQAWEHPGNKQFRALVKMHQENYGAAQCKLMKSKIVSHIVDTVRRQSPNGGFVKLIKGVWHETGDRAAKEKVGQTFRDLLHTKYSSSTKAKSRARVQQQVEEYRQMELQMMKNRTNSMPSLLPSSASSSSDNNSLSEDSSSSSSSSMLEQQLFPPVATSSFPSQIEISNNNNDKQLEEAVMESLEAAIMAPPPKLESQPSLWTRVLSSMDNDELALIEPLPLKDDSIGPIESLLVAEPDLDRHVSSIFATVDQMKDFCQTMGVGVATE